MIHHVFANRQNLGDWLSARGIQSLLGSLPVTEHLCDGPYVAATLRELAAAPVQDPIIIGGGGLFMDYFTPFWEGFCELGRRVPYWIWGVGYCDSTRGVTHPPADLLEEVVRGARRCVVRDELTRRYLGQCDLPAPVACPSLSLVTPLPRLNRQLLHVANLSSVGEAAYEEMLEYTRGFVAKTGRTFCETNNQIPRDDVAALGRQLEMYRAADLVLSSGLHGCVLGVGLGRPVVAVSADQKVDAFMDQAGLAAWVCPYDRLEKLPELLRSAELQPSTAAFVAATQRQHQGIASEIHKEVRCA